MGPIWFLIILYLAELVAYPIFYNKKSNSFWIVSVSCLVAVLWFTLKLALPANFLSSWFLRFLNGLMWYILGYICGIVEHGIRMVSLASKQKIVWTSILLLLSIAIGYLNPGVSMWSNSYGKNYLLFMLGGIIGSIWLGFVCKWFVTRNTFLQFLGQNTITILAVHEPIKRIVLKIAEMGTQRVGMDVTIVELQENTLCSLVVVAVVFAISLIIVNFLRRIKSNLPRKIRDSLMTFIR